MLRIIVFMSLCSLVSFTTASAAHNHTADDHAPIGVMGDHIHRKGEWMTSYRYSHMRMEGNRVGNNKVSTTTILKNFMVAPTDMQMDMHMFGAMYGITNELTLMLMLPLIHKSMNHITRMGMGFNTETRGLGDTKITTLYTIAESTDVISLHRSQHKLYLSLGASIPTGSIEERGTTPAGANQKLPYPMQLGSGTVDPLIALTYVNKHPTWSWGSQINSLLRMGENHEGYRLGNEMRLTGWIAKNIHHIISLSLRVDAIHWGNIHGSDQALNPMMVPTAVSSLRGGTRIDTYLGINLLQPHGPLKGNRLALEFALPAYQQLDGPQLETDYRIIMGWQKPF